MHFHISYIMKLDKTNLRFSFKDALNIEIHSQAILRQCVIVWLDLIPGECKLLLSMSENL